MSGFSTGDLDKSLLVHDGLRKIVVRAGRVQNVSSTGDLDASVHLHDALRLIDAKYDGFGEIRLLERDDLIDEMIIARTVAPGVLSTQDAVIRKPRR